MVLAAAASLAAAAPPPGATACTGCHGPAGPIPPVSGRTAAQIETAMREFRSGARPATVMDRIAKGFTEDETRAIAVWLAGARR